MIEALFKYIEFLLPQYNCVVIPNFGGFVVNIDPAYYALDGTIIAPSYKISFNPELKHDDGLLASNMQKMEDISYETACKNIQDTVAEINAHFVHNKTLQCGNLGKLIYNEGSNFSFVGSSQVVYPSLYGLTSVRMPLLSQIDLEIKKEKKSLNIKYTVSAAAAATFAILLFVGASINVNNTDETDVQQADFIKTLINNNPQTSGNFTSGEDIPQQKIHQSIQGTSGLDIYAPSDNVPRIEDGTKKTDSELYSEVKKK